MGNPVEPKRKMEIDERRVPALDAAVERTANAFRVADHIARSGTPTS